MVTNGWVAQIMCTIKTKEFPVRNPILDNIYKYYTGSGTSRREGVSAIGPAHVVRGLTFSCVPRSPDRKAKLPSPIAAAFEVVLGPSRCRA